MNTAPILSTQDDATARRWADEAGILRCVQTALESGGADRIALFRARVGKSHILVVAWWGWTATEDNGLAALRSRDLAIINRLTAFYATTSRIQCVMHGAKWKSHA